MQSEHSGLSPGTSSLFKYIFINKRPMKFLGRAEKFPFEKPKKNIFITPAIYTVVHVFTTYLDYSSLIFIEIVVFKGNFVNFFEDNDSLSSNESRQLLELCK